MKLKHWIKPREGDVIRDPETGRALPAEGAEVIWNSWWQRRLNDGDIVMTTESAVKAALRKAGKDGEQ
jgi:hypothetical protein